MPKTQPALRILGERVRHYRKLKGLSQAELAKGICTQATISLIEKRNKVPSMNILVRLVARLGVAMGDIVVENRDKTQQILSAVEKLIRHSEFETAKQTLSKLNVDKLKSSDEIKHFYYFSGMIELFAEKQPDEAIYYFGRVLNPLATRERDLLAIMATLGLGLAYAEKGEQERARVYIDQALSLLKGMPLKEAKYLDVELTIYWHTARIYYELGEYQQVLKHVGAGIEVAVSHDSLFLLDKFYALRAQAMEQLGDQEAKATYAIAQALARVNQARNLKTFLKTASA